MSIFPTIFPVTCHTRHVGAGSTFVAIKGMKEDGAQYIPEALERGAKSIVLDPSIHPTMQELRGTLGLSGVDVIYVDDTRRALAKLSAEALNFPARKLKIIGITGTKGKSTTTFLLEHILRTAGLKTALLSTIKNKILDTWIPTELTTQQPDYLHVFFDQCVKTGVEYVVMEVAAQAVTCHRVLGIDLAAGIFTNFSREHGEFYASMDEYFAAKAALFTQLKPEAPFIYNNDDERVRAFAQVRAGSKAAASFKIINNSLTGLELQVDIGQQISVTCPALVGVFNAYNITSSITAAQELGASLWDIQKALETFPGVPGRLDKYMLPNGATAFIDYAHNPASYEAVLGTLRGVTDNLIVVFGAGGDRDPVRRPLMGKIASEIADCVVITTDNPRSEDPAVIAQQIIAGIAPENQHKIVYELDREIAIKKAYQLSQKQSIIALLGKGPDEYQLIQGIKYPFSEAEILRSL